MMREREARVRWAFVLALLLHCAALAGAARVPLEGSERYQELEAIRVFDTSAPAALASVELAELPAEAAPEFTDLPLPLPQEPAAQPPALAARPDPPAPVTPRDPSPLETAGTPPSAAGPDTPSVEPVAPQAEPGDMPDTPPGGGGGGGPIDLGSPSESGDLPGMASGSTPGGEVPGVGAGSGSGVGPGAGSGTGGGSGSGEGAGVGSGVGPGTGDGSAIESGPDFTSRVADRLAPEVIWQGTLEYPESAIADGREGVVRMQVLVTETGQVAEVRVVASSGDRRLDTAAKEWVRRWRYRPAVQDGQPRRVQTRATVRFELN